MGADQAAERCAPRPGASEHVGVAGRRTPPPGCLAGVKCRRRLSAQAPPDAERIDDADPGAGHRAAARPGPWWRRSCRSRRCLRRPDRPSSAASGRTPRIRSPPLSAAAGAEAPAAASAVRRRGCGSRWARSPGSAGPCGRRVRWPDRTACTSAACWAARQLWADVLACGRAARRRRRAGAGLACRSRRQPASAGVRLGCSACGPYIVTARVRLRPDTVAGGRARALDPGRDASACGCLGKSRLQALCPAKLHRLLHMSFHILLHGIRCESTGYVSSTIVRVDRFHTTSCHFATCSCVCPRLGLAGRRARAPTLAPSLSDKCDSRTGNRLLDSGA